MHPGRDTDSDHAECISIHSVVYLERRHATCCMSTFQINNRITVLSAKLPGLPLPSLPLPILPLPTLPTPPKMVVEFTVAEFSGCRIFRCPLYRCPVYRLPTFCINTYFASSLNLLTTRRTPWQLLLVYRLPRQNRRQR